jgi:DNA-binding XRE family transcriptional regulator
MAKKWDRAAMRFASAKYHGRQGVLDVKFENGDHFLVAVEAVLPWISDARSGPIGSGRPSTLTKVTWDKMRISETGDVLEIPANATLIEIPWDRIRAIADPEFRAHLAERAHERARRIGERIRAMRLKAGLTTAAVGEMVGVPHEVIANLEAGKMEPQMDLIQHIAGVLGCRLGDFADEQ